MKKTIAIDIDDVLSATAAGFSKFSDERWGGNHHPDNWQEAWDLFWDIPREEAISRAEEYHRSDAVSAYGSLDNAAQVLRKLKSQYRLIIITSRKVVLRDHTSEWLNKHYQGIFDEVHYAGIWDGGENLDVKLNMTKAEICRELSCDYLIDDQLKHCKGAANVGIDALLFGDYAWNQSAELPENIQRIKDWNAVWEFFSGRA